MRRVEPDGPVPCDLAIVGEAPGMQEVKEGRGFVGPSGKFLWPLIEDYVGRPRSSCYVTNVCKIEMPDSGWRKLTLKEQEHHIEELYKEMAAVSPKVVLAFGRRATDAFVQNAGRMRDCSGKAFWNKRLGCTVVAFYHPAASLRGNAEALPSIVVGLSSVPDLLEDSSAIAEISTVLDEQWPERISFLKLVKKRKKLSCTLCGKKTEIGDYHGAGLKWRFCLPHANLTARWSVRHEQAIRDSARIARLKGDRDALERAAGRVEKKLREKWVGETEHYG